MGGVSRGRNGGTCVTHRDKQTQGHVQKGGQTLLCACVCMSVCMNVYDFLCVCVCVCSLPHLLGFLSNLSIYGVALEQAGDWLLLLGDREVVRKQRERNPA